MSDTIFAQCPTCKQSLRVTVGRKSTERTVTCGCGIRYSYSAWQLPQPRVTPEGVSLKSFYQVDLFPVVRRRK
jgi:hypothetical protein